MTGKGGRAPVLLVFNKKVITHIPQPTYRKTPQPTLTGTNKKADGYFGHHSLIHWRSWIIGVKKWMNKNTSTWDKSRSRPYNYTMFLALPHTSSRYQLRYTRQHKCHLFFSLRVFCETKSSNYGSETKFAHWAGSWLFHIESYYSQQIKGESSPGRSRVEPPKLLQDLSEPFRCTM